MQAEIKNFKVRALGQLDLSLLNRSEPQLGQYILSRSNGETIWHFSRAIAPRQTSTLLLIARMNRCPQLRHLIAKS